MKIFDYVIFVKKDEFGKGENKILKEGRLLESTDQKAAIKVHRKIPEKYLDQLDNLVVAIRPF